MLSLEKIKDFYPQNLQVFEKHLLREYLQYKILEVIYNSKFGKSFVFLGGTALRIAYENQRFSEDLDFDNLETDAKEFRELAILVKEKLEMEGLNVEIKVTLKESFRCYIRISGLLFQENISPHEDEKLTIQVDAFPQKYDFTPNIFTLDKFDIYTKIKIAPIDLILAQKIYCIFNRKRRIGRDFFDVNFLIKNKGVKPDFGYLNLKMNIQNETELVELMKKEFKDINFKELADNVSFLLIKEAHKERVSNFYKDVVEGWAYG